MNALRDSSILAQSSRMKIAILGIRGLPSTYSGYETFVGELAPRLVERGHDVTIYCRKSLYADRPDEYRGMRMKYLPSIEHKALSTLSHTFLSMLHASLSRFDLIFAVNAANGMFGFISRLAGTKCVLNVDGMEWLRPKWNRLGRLVFKNSARMGTWFYNEIVTDADEMHRLYARDFGIDTTYIAYGANIETSTDAGILAQYGLEPKSYYLIASRLIPDNNADLIVEAFCRTDSRRVLAIAGSADYRGNTVERAFIDRLRRLGGSRVKFLGHVNSSDHIKELHCNCYAYIHGHQFGGINPSLLKALGYGNAVLALNTPFNAEVLDHGKYGVLFEKRVEDLAAQILDLDHDDAKAETLRRLAPQRIHERFTWKQITDEYESLFTKVLGAS